MTIRAVWHDTVIAESDNTVRVEGNHYFPVEDVRTELFEESPTRTVCPWKGRAHYWTVVVDGKRNQDAAWYYPHPWPLARRITGRVAFWRGVTVTQSRPDTTQARGWRKLLPRSGA